MQIGLNKIRYNVPCNKGRDYTDYHGISPSRYENFPLPTQITYNINRKIRNHFRQRKSSKKTSLGNIPNKDNIVKAKIINREK